MPAPVGFSGTMVSAVFETLGYRYQSYLIDTLSSSFQGELGGLIYLVGVVAAIFAAAAWGHYKMGAWLLIGPPLFFVAVLTRSQVQDARWVFAKMPRDQSQVNREVQNALALMGSGGGFNGLAVAGGTANTGANVSTLFARYNHLVSVTIQEMMRTINRNKPSTDRMFIVRAQLLANLYTQSIDDPGFLEVVQHAMMGSCRRTLENVRIVDSPLSSPAQRRAAQLASNGNASGELDRVRDIRLTPAGARWVAGVLVARTQGQEGLVANPTAYQLEIVARMTQLRTRQNFTCRELWAFIYDGLVRHGMIVVDRTRRFAIDNQIDQNALLRDLVGATGLAAVDGDRDGTITAQQIDNLARVVALYILRNAVRSESNSGRIAEQAGRTRESPRIEISLADELVLTEQTRTAATEWGEKTRLMTAATNLPYYQGLLLFGLGLSFPFFALLLLVPGKHGGFVLWFVLWFWVKSWDLGMAIVMQLDDIMFSLLTINKREIQSADVLRNSLEWVALVIREIDPTFHLSTYYNIMACCVLAIPVISSQVIMGSLNGGASLVAAGAMLFSGEFARASHSGYVSTAITGLRYDLEDYRRASTEVMQNTRLGLPRVIQDGHSALPVQVAMGGKGLEIVHPRAVRFGPMDPWGARGGMGKDGYGDPAASAVFKESPLKRSMPSSPLAARFAALQTLRGRQGAANGFADPTGFSSSTLENVMLLFAGRKAFANMLFGMPEKLQVALAGGARIGELAFQAEANYMQESIRQDLNVTAVHAGSDAIYSEYGRRTAFLIRLYGALEVPINATELGDIAEADRILALRKREYDAYANAFGAVTELFQRIDKLSGSEKTQAESLLQKLGAKGGAAAGIAWLTPGFKEFAGQLSGDAIKTIVEGGLGLFEAEKPRQPQGAKPGAAAELPPGGGAKLERHHPLGQPELEFAATGSNWSYEAHLFRSSRKHFEPVAFSRPQRESFWGYEPVERGSSTAEQVMAKMEVRELSYEDQLRVQRNPEAVEEILADLRRRRSELA